MRTGNQRAAPAGNSGNYWLRSESSGGGVGLERDVPPFPSDGGVCAVRPIRGEDVLGTVNRLRKEASEAVSKPVEEAKAYVQSAPIVGAGRERFRARKCGWTKSPLQEGLLVGNCYPPRKFLLCGTIAQLASANLDWGKIGEGFSTVTVTMPTTGLM
jgi:hypothetical protein